MEDPRKHSLSRLLDAADKKKVHGPAAVAKALNVSDQAINNWKTRGVPHAMAVKAQQLWSISAQWISTGDGAQWLDAGATAVATPASHGELVESDEEAGLLIHQYDVGGAMGCGGKLILEAEPPGIIKSWRVDNEWLRLNVPIYTSLSNLCIVTGFGPSMKPIFNPGDPLLMDRGVNNVDHEGIYFFRLGDEGFIKIIQRVPNFDKPGFVLRIISKNKEDFPPYDISSKHPDFHVIGKILTVWRSEQY